MQTLFVKKLYTKEISYTDKSGKPRSFTKYAVNDGKMWFTIDGKGKENAIEGQILKGNVTQKDYMTKDGKPGIEYIFTLIEPEIAELYERVERLENLIKNVNKQPFPDKSNSPIGDEENENLPFWGLIWIR